MNDKKEFSIDEIKKKKQDELKALKKMLYAIEKEQLNKLNQSNTTNNLNVTEHEK